MYSSPHREAAPQLLHCRLEAPDPTCRPLARNTPTRMLHNLPTQLLPSRLSNNPWTAPGRSRRLNHIPLRSSSPGRSRAPAPASATK